MTKTKRKQRIFTPEFKRQSVALFESPGHTVTPVAAEIDVHETVLRHWIAQMGSSAKRPNAGRAAAVAGPSLADQAAEIAQPRREHERLRMEHDIIKSPVDPRNSKEMLFQFIDETRDDFPVETLCDVLGVSKSGFYAWKSRPVSARAREDAQTLAVTREVHRKSKGAYRSPRVHAVLCGHGRRIGITPIERLMRADAIRGAVALKRKPRITDSNPALPIAPNLLERNFSASAPSMFRVADITYVHTDEGWLYLAGIMDLCTR